MTQEEKARAYDEALKKAQCWLNDPQTIQDCNYTIEDAIQNIFPVLAKNEDERIRKRLIEYFEGFRMGNAEVKWEGLTVQEVLAWLEKQKEHKTAEWSEEDETMLRTIISDGSRGVELDSKQISWLKSLRSRVGKEFLQPHWKPSEEQMKALKCAVGDIARFSKRGGRQVELENEPYYSALQKRGKERTGEVLTCWRLTDEEKALVQMTGEIWLSTLTFGQPLQPVSLSATRPEIYDPE